MSNLLPNAFQWDFCFEEMIFLKSVVAKDIIITIYVQPNDTMTINKFRSVTDLRDFNTSVHWFV